MSSRNSNKHRAVFSTIPDEIILHQILPYFDYNWVLKTARLVCKFWNENHKTINTFYFPIKYNGNINKLKVIMDEHLDELHKITEFDIRKLSKDESGVELETSFISKLTNLQDLKLSSDCNSAIVNECTKLKTLRSVKNVQHIEEFIIKCPSQIKSLDASFFLSKYYGMNIQAVFNVDWPLEELSLSGPIHNGLTSESYISLFNNKTITKNLKKLAIPEVASSVLELFENLESIISLSCPLHDDQAKYISKLGTLKELENRHSRCNDEGVKYISQLPRLEKVTLCFGQITGSGLSDFVKLKNITWLNLSNNSIGNEGANYLSRVTNLQYLNLNYNNISDEGLKNYCKLVNITRLDLGGNQIGSNGANYLSSIPNITYLILNNNQIDAEGLINFGNLNKLKNLYIQNNKIGSGFKYLSSYESLFLLNVENNNICENDVFECCKNWKFKGYFFDLTISNNKIGSTAFYKLTQLGFNVIRANNCRLTDRGIKMVLEESSTVKTSYFDLASNKFTNSSLKEIVEFPGDVRKIIGNLRISDSSVFDNNLKLELSKKISVHFDETSKIEIDSISDEDEELSEEIVEQKTMKENSNDDNQHSNEISIFDTVGNDDYEIDDSIATELNDQAVSLNAVECDKELEKKSDISNENIVGSHDYEIDDNIVTEFEQAVSKIDLNVVELENEGEKTDLSKIISFTLLILCLVGMIYLFNFKQ